MLDPTVRAQMLAPPIATAALPGIGGRIKQRVEDFVVDEIPAYAPDGREGRHLLLRVRKRELGTPELVQRLARRLGVAARDIGVAGRKDRDAVTTQWLSVPFDTRNELEGLDLEQVELLEARPHGQKLRMGHLRGNRFRIVVRDTALDGETARQNVRRKIIAIERDGGLENAYGAQRFGREGENLERGLDLLASGRRLDLPGQFLVSAAQSGLFNLYLALRKEQGWLRQVLPGDLLHLRDASGLFAVEDVRAEQARLDRGEVVVSGPIFGSKMKQPADPSPSALLEQEVLRRAGVDPEPIRAAGKKVPGSRRPVQVPVSDFRVEVVEASAEMPGGLELRFALPAGSYATQLLRELQTDP